MPGAFLERHAKFVSGDGLEQRPERQSDGLAPRLGMWMGVAEKAVERPCARLQGLDHRRFFLANESRRAADVGAHLVVGGSALSELRLEGRSEEHTSELQSQSNLVCRLLLE